jgi:23S rRNA (pseudouridine1915-N3)-methyltransferase
MKVICIVVGKTDSKWLKEGIETFSERIKHYVPFEIKVIPGLKNIRNLTTSQQKEKEGELINSCLNGKGEVYLLDESGNEFSSREFAGFLEKKMIMACRELIFVIGGPYGFSENLVRQVNGKVSLSKLTFSHQLVRLLFVEQLYRAFSIIRGESYHND